MKDYVVGLANCGSNRIVVMCIEEARLGLGGFALVLTSYITWAGKPLGLVLPPKALLVCYTLGRIIEKASLVYFRGSGNLKFCGLLGSPVDSTCMRPLRGIISRLSWKSLSSVLHNIWRRIRGSPGLTWIDFQQVRRMPV
jgi:hypothetical protein